MVEIFLEQEKKNLSQEFTGRIADLLTALRVNKETVVVVKNGTIVTEDVFCSGDDEIKVLSVVSGG